MTRRSLFAGIFTGCAGTAIPATEQPQSTPTVEQDMELAATIYRLFQNPGTFQDWPENKIIGHIAALIRYRDLDEAGEGVYLHAADSWTSKCGVCGCCLPAHLSVCLPCWNDEFAEAYNKIGPEFFAKAKSDLARIDWMQDSDID